MKGQSTAEVLALLGLKTSRSLVDAAAVRLPSGEWLEQRTEFVLPPGLPDVECSVWRAPLVTHFRNDNDVWDAQPTRRCGRGWKVLYD